MIVKPGSNVTCLLYLAGATECRCQFDDVSGGSAVNEGDVSRVPHVLPKAGDVTLWQRP